MLVFAIGGICLVTRWCGPRHKLRAKSGVAHPGATSTTIRYPGLRNAGNSCYLNCILQAMASVHQCLGLELLHQSALVSSLSDILMALNMPRIGVLSCDKLVEAMGGRLNSQQQDAHELLQALLSVLSKHQSTSSAVKSTQSIYPLQLQPVLRPSSLPWEGMQCFRVRCSACGTTSSGTHTHAFSMLTLPPAGTLDLAFQCAYAPVYLTDYQCGSCSKWGYSFKQESIIRWPTILIIHIQRIVAANGIVCKEQDPVVFGLELAGWRQSRRAFCDPNRPGYELAAVIEHQGGLNSGHYVAYRQVVEGSQTRWLFCSDSCVRAVSAEQVLSAQAYILFYTRSP